MKKLFACVAMLFLFGSFAPEGGLKTGDTAPDFKLKNIDGKMYSLASDASSKGFIVIFTCNHCPFSVKYEDRIIALDKAYKKKGYPVVAINPNDTVQYPDDSFSSMMVRAKEKKFLFPYLIDETQLTARAYGATRTPHVYILQKEKNSLVVKYIGAIDDNSEDASAVKIKYAENALEALIAGKPVDPGFTKAVGCSIKWKP